MSITGPGSITAANLAAQNNMFNQLNTLSTQIGTGKAAQTYAGLASQAGVALSLSGQLSAMGGYANTTSMVGNTLTLAQSVLTELGNTGSGVQQAISKETNFTLDGNGQSPAQAAAANYLDEIVSLLNTQVGSNYLFSGSAVGQPSVASTSDILNGNGSQAGLKQVIAQRLDADEGTADNGRLTVGGTGAQVTLSGDGSPFGFQLAGANASLDGATVSGPAGTPPTITVDLTSNPSAGQSINVSLTLPDGTNQTISLQATTDSPPGANQFTIGTSAAQTAGYLQTALGGAISNLAQTVLPAASAVAAANDFFADPPQRVDPGSPPDYASATSLVDGTAADTVMWYTGEDGNTPALQTAVAQVGPAMSVSYGMRANEPAITALIANVAVLAATSYSASDPNAAASYQALSQRVTANLTPQSGTQSITDIEANLANAQTSVAQAAQMNTQTQNTLQNMLQDIEGVNLNEIGEKFLTLQNNLSASMSVTARLAQMSLVNYLGGASG